VRTESRGTSQAELAERLRARRGEIEETLLTRTYAIADPAEAADPEYVQGLRAAVSAALDYGLAAVEHGEERAPSVPVLLLAQARLAARNGVPLDTVLRRYFAGYTLLGDFIVQEAGAANLKESWLKSLLRDQAAMFDRFLAAIGEEHGREGEFRIASTERRRVERVERLLAGDLLDVSEFSYDFDGWSLGAIASGPNSAGAFRELAKAQDCRLLQIRREDELAWAWLGSRRPLDPAELVHVVSSLNSRPVAVAFGEPAEGLSGWRLTHRQARAAYSVVLRGPASVARYADVALLASILQDDLLCASLREIYLAPLEAERDQGVALLEALSAYFAASRNVSAAAAALGASRNTIAGRLGAVEQKLGHSLADCATDLEVALCLQELDRPSPRPI
jgi:hypothetical protein